MIPTNPGCYIFKDNKDKIIYIGKAKNLRKRVNSYFQKKDHDEKTRVLVENVATTDFIATDNEIEALILENNLIKKNQPKFNIRLKDSKRYAYIKLTADEFPRLLLAREFGSGKYFGPFTTSIERDHVFKLCQRMFMLRTCKKIPKRPCLRLHINLCTGPCAGKISKKEYSHEVYLASKVLSGKSLELIKELKKDMKEASKNKKYEIAMERRDQISSLEYLKERQNMERMKKYDEDIINYIVICGKVYLILFNIYKGTLINKQEYVFSDNPNFLEEFILQYYSENSVPKELIVPDSVDESLVKFLAKKRGNNVKVIIPSRGSKKQLLDLVQKNIEITFFGDIEKVKALRDKLKLHDLPSVIECFDISHLSGTSTVGSMVQFRNGKPDKSNYRRFKIRTVSGVDDTASIAEVVRRRYTRLKNEKSNLPDLIIIDGGKGQLNSAWDEIVKLGIRIPMISVAKRLEEVYVLGLSFPLRFDSKEKALLYIREMRDEAHRFAISYHKLLRKKEIM
ncbi:MAG: excinuclease ABC subunit UvrC [Nanoarchaeota archaeon]